MFKHRKRSTTKIGMPPGTIIYVGPERMDQVKVTVTQYGLDLYEERQCNRIEEIFETFDKGTITWIHVNGLHDTSIIKSLGHHYAIDDLILEDILNTAQRPKFEAYDDCLFIVMKALYQKDQEKKIPIAHMNIILKSNLVLSFQEGSQDLFLPIRKRIQNPRSRFRQLGADYLVYALADIIADHAIMVTERLHESIETVEENLIDADPSQAILETIHGLKRNIISMNRTISPLRDIASQLVKTDFTFITETSEIYRRDLYDHTIQIVESLEACREMVKGVLEIYHSSVSHKMNEVMKVLTIIATIFIPLSFIAGIYGTNFKYMPELEWRWGYLLFWGLIAGVGLTMVVYFKRKKWF